jgi:hypothetical protein
MKSSLTANAAFAAVGLLLAQITPAQAGSISTPILLLGAANQIMCIANNVTPQAINNVTVTIVGTNGTSTKTCNIGPNDPDGCRTFRTNDQGYCVITVPGLTPAQTAARLRGSLLTRTTTSPFTVHAVVQAQ